MRNRLIEGVEAPHLKSKPFEFEIGDTVSVGVRITEGTKTRVQPFIGVVIARRGTGTNATFTVRRIVNNEGVERIFPIHSPNLVSIEVQRHGKIRRGKLYYLRGRVGKAQKLAERRVATSASTNKKGGSGGAATERLPEDNDGGSSAVPEGAEVVAGV